MELCMKGKFSLAHNLGINVNMFCFWILIMDNNLPSPKMETLKNQGCIVGDIISDMDIRALSHSIEVLFSFRRTYADRSEFPKIHSQIYDHSYSLFGSIEYCDYMFVLQVLLVTWRNYGCIREKTEEITSSRVARVCFKLDIANFIIWF